MHYKNNTFPLVVTWKSIGKRVFSSENQDPAKKIYLTKQQKKSPLVLQYTLSHMHRYTPTPASFPPSVQGEGTQPPPCPSPRGSLMIRELSGPTPPHHPTLLASCEISDNQPNHIICPRLYCCQLQAETAGQPGTNFSQSGEKSTLNTLHIWLAPFEFCGRIFDKWPPIRKSPITLPTTPSSIYLYIIATVCHRAGNN
jgi:hypothetical protein